MTFATGYKSSPDKVGAGEIHGGGHCIWGARSFQDGLTVGRFAQVKAGVISNMDATATPTLAGVVMRNAASPVEAASVLNTAYYANADIVLSNMVTVDAVAADTPTMFAPIYAVNTAGADIGKATVNASGTIATRGRFLEVIQPGVWLIQLY